MSYSEIIKEIENKGFEKCVIDAFSRAEGAYKRLKEAEEKMTEAKSTLHEYSSDLDSLLSHAAENCNKYIVDNTVPGIHILRIIESDILYEIKVIGEEDKITWFSYRCNVANNSNP